MILVYLKIPKNFVRFLFQDGLRFMHIPFVCMIEFKLLTQFFVDHIAHPVVSSLILSLLKCTAFVYYDPFIFITTSAILLRLVYSCFDIVIMLLFCAVIRRNAISFSRVPFFSHAQVFSCMISLVCPLKSPSYLPNPSARAGYDTRSIFKRSLTGLNSEFSFS